MNRVVIVSVLDGSVKKVLLVLQKLWVSVGVRLLFPKLEERLVFGTDLRASTLHAVIVAKILPEVWAVLLVTMTRFQSEQKIQIRYQPEAGLERFIVTLHQVVQKLIARTRGNQVKFAGSLTLRNDLVTLSVLFSTHTWQPGVDL